MKKAFVLLSLVVVFFCSTGFAIEWAGNAVIHLDAMDLDVGNVSAWTNKVGVGGNFNNVQGDPHVDEVTEGLNGVPKKMVHFEAASLDSNVECMRWENNGPASITGGHSFSTEVWVHPESVQAWQLYFATTSRNDGTNPTKFAIGMNIGALRNAGYNLGIQYSQDPVLDKFHLMTVTFNSATKDVKMYVNGVLQNTVNMPGWSVTTGRPVTIGAWLNGAETMYYYGLHGGIAELRVHDGTLTPEQIVANFNEQKDDFIYETYADVEQAKPAGMNGAGFGEVTPGNTAGPVTFIYKNIGNAALDLTNVAIVGSSAFTMDPATPDLSDLAPGVTRTIQLYFSPTDSTQQTADLTITSNGVTSPNSFPLSGNLDPIYIDADAGSDVTGDGSVGNPYQTMMYALDQVGLSGEIIAATGDYTAKFSNAFQNKNVIVTAPEGATLEGTNWWLFNSGENYLTIDGFTFFSNNYIVRGAFAKEGACDLSWTVRNCTFNFPICEGALLNGGADFGTRPLDITVENCTFNLIGEATETRIGSVAGLGSQGNLSITDCVMNGGNRRCPACS
jgi:hypothetical protein